MKKRGVYAALFFACEGPIAGKPAPTGFWGERRICERHRPLWERACPRWSLSRQRIIRICHL